jgi:hypothetical protein
LTYRFRQEGRGYRLDIEPGVTPPGGYVIRWPEGETPPGSVRIDGRAASFTGQDLAIPAGARRIDLR